MYRRENSRTMECWRENNRMLHHLGSKLDFLRYLFLGVFSAAHDLKVEWVIIKGISDYADGTASSTEHWKPFASAMAASVVSYMLRVPVVFDDWPHYQTHDVRAGTLRSAMNTLSALELPVLTLIFFENIRNL